MVDLYFIVRPDFSVDTEIQIFSGTVLEASYYRGQNALQSGLATHTLPWKNLTFRTPSPRILDTPSLGSVVVL